MHEVAQVALGRCPQCGAVHPETMLRCPDTDMMLPLGGRLLDGRFRLLECIGRGGMASVWLALNERVDRRVAIKLIRADVASDDDMVARFRAEARAAGRIGHPNICDILDSGRSPIGPYIIMELLEGQSLGDLLADGARLEAPVAVMLVREALRGLQAAHRVGIVHRDLKPDNIFLHTPEGGAPILKLMDFGVAKFIDGSGEAQTQHGALLGTPEYMAPEQFRGAAFAEPRTDIWAVGAILYRALTGKTAFGGPTVAATLLMVASEEPRPVTELAPDTPGGLADIIARCLLKQPALRFADVAELDGALAPYDLPVRDVSVWARAGTGDSAPANAPLVGSARTRLWSRGSSQPPAPRRARAWLAAGVVLASGVGVTLWRLGTPRPEPASVGAASALSTDDPEAPSHPSQEIGTGAAPSLASAASASSDSGAALEPTASETQAGELPEPQTTRPDVPPPPPLEDVVVVVESEAELDRGEPTRPFEPSVPDPAGVVRVGRWVALIKPGPPGPLRLANAYCENLAATAHLGIRRWELPNPAIAAKFAGNAGASAASKRIRKGRYWTSALWRGNALSIALPSGHKESAPATDTKPRVLCVARWP